MVVTLTQPVPESQMDETERELQKLEEYYDAHLRERLERESFGHWAVVTADGLIGVYAENREAAKVAAKYVYSQPTLVRYVGHELGFDPVLGFHYVSVRSA